MLANHQGRKEPHHTSLFDLRHINIGESQLRKSIAGSGDDVVDLADFVEKRNEVGLESILVSEIASVACNSG